MADVFLTCAQVSAIVVVKTVHRLIILYVLPAVTVMIIESHALMCFARIFHFECTYFTIDLDKSFYCLISCCIDCLR